MVGWNLVWVDLLLIWETLDKIGLIGRFGQFQEMDIFPIPIDPIRAKKEEFGADFYAVNFCIVYHLHYSFIFCQTQIIRALLAANFLISAVSQLDAEVITRACSLMQLGSHNISSKNIWLY